MSAQTRGGVVSFSVAATTNAVTAVPANEQRQFLMIQNTDSSINVGISFTGTAAIGSDGTFVLTPYQGLLLDNFVATSPVSVVAASGSPQVAIVACQFTM